MLNYEYDAEAEQRMIRQESQLEGIELVSRLQREGMSFVEAIEQAKKEVSEGHQNAER
jgi:uncharacterized protein YoaH (UPF0181 family)